MLIHALDWPPADDSKRDFLAGQPRRSAPMGHYYTVSGKPPTPTHTSGTTMRDLAARLRGLPPSLGPVRLIGVDGHAGAGKSTFAGHLAAALGGAPVLHLDDIASHEQLFEWTDRLMTQVIHPLARGERAHYAPYDWRARAFGAPRPL